MVIGFLNVLSALFGWVYTLCWSLSFYPQPLLNCRRKSTSGTTIDFPLINCMGFLAYLLFNLTMYYSPVVRAQYAARNGGHHPAVAFNDIAFASHALLLSLITASQYFFPRAWGFATATATTTTTTGGGGRGGGTLGASSRPSRFILGTVYGCAAGVLAVVVLILGSSGGGGGDVVDPREDWCWLDAVYALGYVKLWVTLIKFTPQVLTNFRNKSTVGWSIWQILLDFAGGVLSISQLIIDSSLEGDWSGVTGNPVKFALGQVSMIYDLIFFTQHYVLYRDTDGKTGERDALLENGETHGRID